MKYHKNNINRIFKISPVIIYDAETDKNYMLKSGIHVIEYDDNSVSTIDVKNNTDLTNIEEFEIKLFKKSKQKIIYDISKNDKMLGF